MAIHFCVLHEHYVCIQCWHWSTYLCIRAPLKTAHTQRTHIHAYLSAHTHTHACMHARTHTCTHNCTFTHAVCPVSLSMYMYCLLQSVAMCIQYTYQTGWIPPEIWAVCYSWLHLSVYCIQYLYTTYIHTYIHTYIDTSRKLIGGVIGGSLSLVIII